MTRPSLAALAFARSTLPPRRVASVTPAQTKLAFANLLQGARAKPPSFGRTAKSTATYNTTLAPGSTSMATGSGPAPVSRSEILSNAEKLLNIPYVWAGTSSKGLDCSAFVSQAWGVGRHTTDSLASVAQPISKEDLQAGDALNLTTGQDPDGTGHVRLFDRWANPEHTRMSVYEETPPKSIHHVISWDSSYQPMRRFNVTEN